MKHKVQAYWTSTEPSEIDLKFDKQVRIFVDCLPTRIDKNEITILMGREPNAIYNLSDHIINNIEYCKESFDYILTYDKNVLEKYPDAVLFEFGTTWIWDYKFKEKEFGVSTIVGHKKRTEGHLFRQLLWHRQHEIKIPARFFLSAHGGPSPLDVPERKNTNNTFVLGTKTGDKQVAFDTQFHIAIENTKEDYWFTEKLIDCFITKTVPVYWGCPSIEKYFNTDGMIIADNVDEIITAVNSLTPQTYERMKNAIEQNYEASKKFASLQERLKSKLKELIGPAEAGS